MDEPLVSVIVPTFNRVDRLRRVLEGLAEQSLAEDAFEVIVVSDGSTDGTDDYLRGDEIPRPIVALTQPNSGPAAARNRGLAHAKAELVLFVDDDVVPSPDLVAEHLAAHAQHADTVVIGPMLTPTDHDMSPWIEWEQRMLYKQYDDMKAGVYSATARQFYTGNASVPRRHIVSCGGFDERFRRAEDVELAFRLNDQGLSFHFHPSAVAFHYAERSFDSWREIAYVYGRNDVIMARFEGREWLAPFIVWAYQQHHLAVRIATRFGVAVPVGGRTILSATTALVRLEVGRLPRVVTAAALSIIYSIRYHQGVADELGGATNFRAMLAHGSVDPSWLPVGSRAPRTV